MFDKRKQLGRALSPSAIKEGIAAGRDAMAGGGQFSRVQLAAGPVGLLLRWGT